MKLRVNMKVGVSMKVGARARARNSGAELIGINLYPIGTTLH